MEPPAGCAPAAFGTSLQDLARAGRPPLVLVDCLRYLAARGLTTPALFSRPADRRRLLVLRAAYEAGRRPLRGARAANKDPHTAANLLLLWLSSLPDAVLPAGGAGGGAAPALAAVAAARRGGRAAELGALRALLRRAEPAAAEGLFPLFELLHHWWLNQPDRAAELAGLAELFAPLVFGVCDAPGGGGGGGGGAPGGLPPGAAAAAARRATALLVAEYRPLFTQPCRLTRYEDDAAAAAAAAAAAGGGGAGSPPPLTPRRLARLSVVCPPAAAEGGGAAGMDVSPAAGPPADAGGDAALEGVVAGLLEAAVAGAFAAPAAAKAAPGSPVSALAGGAASSGGSCGAAAASGGADDTAATAAAVEAAA